jgi:DNA primase
VAGGAETEDFRVDNVPPRIAKLGDLWKSLLAVKGRTNLEKFLT